MDNSTILASTGTAGTVITILYFIYRAINGKRCHISCCDTDLDAEFKVDNMTPPDRKNYKSKFELNNPLKVIIPK